MSPPSQEQAEQAEPANDPPLLAELPTQGAAADLVKKIRDRTATIAVIGLGYVGLPLSRAFWDAGFTVLGFDVDQSKIDMLNAGNTYLKHLGEQLVSDMVVQNDKQDGAPNSSQDSQPIRFEATADFARLGEADAILACVPTPLGKHLEPDLSFVEKTGDAIAQTLRSGQLIVLESTTYPRTTREILQTRFDAKGLTCGDDYFLAYSPEREDPGRKDQSTATIPKLVGGIDPISGSIATLMYRCAVKQVIEVSSAEVAESAKLLENIYRAVNIALVNEMKIVLQAMDIDIWEVVAAAATKPFGFQPFYPGPGLGGHCIPIDPFYLTWKAREVGLPTRFIELAGQVNHAMPNYVVTRVTLALNERGKPVSASRILVLGLAYKPDVDDTRESPSFELIEKLQALGASVDYNDPHVATTGKKRDHDLHMKSVEVRPESLGCYDCVLIATHHAAYDWQMIHDHAPLIIDTRNAMKDTVGDRSHIVLA